MKVYNVLLGLQNHASSHPCPCCESPKEWNCTAPLWSFGRLREKANQFQSSTSKNPKPKNFLNCVELPLLNFPDETLVLSKICIPELYLLLGIVNRLFDQLCKLLGEENMLDWAKENQIQRASYRGGGFQGKPCTKILEKAENLKDFLPEHLKAYADCLIAFNKVWKSCFGAELESNCQDHIDEFEKKYSLLKISTPPKVHIDNCRSF